MRCLVRRKRTRIANSRGLRRYERSYERGCPEAVDEFSTSHGLIGAKASPWRLVPLMNKLCCLVRLHFERVGHSKQHWDWQEHAPESLKLDSFVRAEIHKLTSMHQLSHRESRYLRSLVEEKLFHADPLYYSTYTKKNQ